MYFSFIMSNINYCPLTGISVEKYKKDRENRRKGPSVYLWGPPGVLGIWGEWLFILRELRSTGNYLRGAREQAHNFGDIGSLAKKQKNTEKPPFFFIF